MSSHYEPPANYIKWTPDQRLTPEKLLEYQKMLTAAPTDSPDATHFITPNVMALLKKDSVLVQPSIIDIGLPFYVKEDQKADCWIISDPVLADAYRDGRITEDTLKLALLTREVKSAQQLHEKRFNVVRNVGKSRYVINHTDGTKKHNDGSAFYDIIICKSHAELDLKLSQLLQRGYVEESGMSLNLSKKTDAALAAMAFDESGIPVAKSTGAEPIYRNVAPPKKLWVFSVLPVGDRWLPCGKGPNGEEVWCDGCCVPDKRLAQMVANNMNIAFETGWNAAMSAIQATVRMALPNDPQGWQQDHIRDTNQEYDETP